MKNILPFVASFVAILLVAVGCGGGDEMTEPIGTQLTLVAETADPAADEATVFKVTTSNAQAHITSIKLDYTNAGIWDDTRTVGAPAVCSGCSATLGGDFPSAVRRPIGMREHGTLVTVSQGFSQSPFTGGQDVLYACSFSMRIVTGTAPYETTIGSGAARRRRRSAPRS